MVVTAVLAVCFGRIGDMFAGSRCTTSVSRVHRRVTFALVMCLIAAAASWLRGSKADEHRGEIVDSRISGRPTTVWLAGFLAAPLTSVRRLGRGPAR